MSCTCVLVRVDQNDLISATGNTNPLYDNKVFFSGITGCNNTSISVEYSGSGYYFHCAHTTGYTCNCSGSGWVKYNETACIKSATTAGYTPDPSDLYEVEDAVSNIQSCLYGTLFFDSGYSLCGSGVAVASVPSGTYWANTTLSTLNGPYNREAIWTDLPADKPYDTWLGLSYCTLTGTTDMKTYYIGIGAVNNFKVVLDGVEILDTTAGPCITGTQSLTTWRVYPISVGVGSHIIEYYGYNYGNPGGVGFVIYDKDLSSLTASTTDVAAGVIYNSNSEIGNNFEFCQDLSGDYLISGYTCPVGYTYSVCLGTCVKFNYCELTPILTDTPSLFYYQDNILLSGTSIDSIYDDRESLCSTSGDCTSSICTSTSGFCLNDTGYDTYDDYYIESGYHNGNPYWSGETDGLLIYYSTGNTQWCLSTVLDGDCLLFGKSPCVSVCPDLCDTYFSNVICPTPTPSPTIPCSALNFDAIFNCNVPSPSVTPTQTPTLTPTPTQSPAVLCPNIFVNASINSYSPTPTPTQTVTPTPSGVVNRPFGLSGDVTFNTVDEKIKCPVSLQFQDCITGMIYSTMDDVETPLGGSLSQYMVFEGTVNGDIKCMYYIGQNQNISGIDQIILTNGPLGYSNLDGCNYCFLTPTPTPTPTVTPEPLPTQTPTPTPTQIPINCITCGIGTDYYVNTGVGLIEFGNITGTCSVTDYQIQWIGPFPSTNVSFTSGKGTLYTYNYEHPLTGTSAVLQPEGSYKPLIHKIVIDGIEYTDLDCFGYVSVEVESFTCSNVTPSDLPQYSNMVEFSNAGQGESSIPLSASFIITGATNYFAWRFQGYTVADELKLTLVGTSYSTPIILDYWKVGGELPSTNFTSYPFSADTSSGYINKVLCLTGITLTNNDRIDIEVIPNSANTQTNWKLYFTCLDTFDCSSCLTNLTPTAGKINLSTLSSSVDSCGVNHVNLVSTFCDIGNEDLHLYYGNYSQDFNFVANYDYSTLNPPSYYHNQTTISTSFYLSPGNLGYNECNPITSNSITHEKYINGITNEGEIKITFGNYNDLQNYYDNYISVTPYSGTPFNSLDINYYRYYVFNFPESQGSTNCGDVPEKQYNIHTSTVVTTGGTGPWTMIMTMPLMSNDYVVSSCDIGYYEPLGYVTSVNYNSTGTTNYSGTSNTGAYYKTPISRIWRLITSFGSRTTSELRIFQRILYATLDTIPVSGSTYTQIPSLSSSTCPDILDNFTMSNVNGFPNYPSNPSYLGKFIYKALTAYKFMLTNPSNPADFDIYASPISVNGSPVLLPGSDVSGIEFGFGINYNTLIYRYSGGTVTYIDMNYFV